MVLCVYSYLYYSWIGQQYISLLRSLRPSDVLLRPSSRAEDDKGVERDLIDMKPDRVVALIGRTHGPGYSTIDYLEQPGKLVENVRDNLFSPLLLAILCQRHNIHYTYLGTGCIFKYDNSHALGSKVGFSETDKPNFFGSSYSIVKGFTDQLFNIIQGNTLNLRIRMPITADNSKRNFITKITTYERICSIENSMTVLPDLLPVMIDMSYNKHTGTFNMTNPGVIPHNEILGMYRDIVDSTFTWKNFSAEEMRKILASDRSNNYLYTDKLTQYYPQVKDIKNAVKDIMLQMKHNRTNKQ